MLLRINEGEKAWEVFSLFLDDQNFQGEDPVIIPGDFPQDLVQSMLKAMPSEWLERFKMERLDELSQRSELNKSLFRSHVRRPNPRFKAPSRDNLAHYAIPPISLEQNRASIRWRDQTD